MTRILVADDDHAVRAALRAALEVEGYEVEAVSNGERAMEAHEKRPADVLVMPDGALLVSDDHAGAIYRISYHAADAR